MIICVVGPSCAGKTTSSEYMEFQTGIPFLEASDYVRESFLDSGYEGQLIEFVIERFNQDKQTFARRLWDDIRKRNVDNLIISGFRAIEEVEYIHKKSDYAVSIGVFAHAQTRFLRNLNREEGRTFSKYQSFIQRDMLEYNFGIAEVFREECDEILINEGSFNHLYKQIDECVIDKHDLN